MKKFYCTKIFLVWSTLNIRRKKKQKIENKINFVKINTQKKNCSLLLYTICHYYCDSWHNKTKQKTRRETEQTWPVNGNDVTRSNAKYCKRQVKIHKQTLLAIFPERHFFSFLWFQFIFKCLTFYFVISFVEHSWILIETHHEFHTRNCLP